MAINVVEDFEDVLQNIEHTIITVYGANPALKDTDVIAATELLITRLGREKKKLPTLPLMIKGLPLAVYEAMYAVVDTRLNRASDEIIEGDELGYRIPYRFMHMCLERLLKSMRFWHGKDGARGYLGYVGGFVK